MSDLLTLRQVAERLVVSETTVRRLCAAGVLDEARLGPKTPRVTLFSVQRVLAVARGDGDADGGVR